MSTAQAEKELGDEPGVFSKFKAKIKTKSRFISSVFTPDVFTPSSSKEDIRFLKCVPEIRHTDIIDVYDVIFTLRMPDSVPKGALWTEHTDKEQYLNFYCNNKLSVKLFFNDETIFSDTEGMTSCLLSPPVNIDKATTTYVSDDGTTETKASGIYFAKYNDLNKKISEVVKEAIPPGAGAPSITAEQTLAFNKELADDKKKRIEFSDKLYVQLAP